MQQVSLLILCSIWLYSEQVQARRSFGAHQNVQGIDADNGQPNVVMQSVVLGRNQSNREDEITEDENEIEAVVRKLMKVFCPCVSNKYSADDEEQDQCDHCGYNNDNNDVTIRKLTKLLSNKLNRDCNSEEINEDQYKRGRKWGRRRTPIIPYRSRAKSKYSRFQEDDDDEIPESTENMMKRNSNLIRRRYSIDSNEFDNKWSRPEPNMFRLRRKPNISRYGRQKHRDNWCPALPPPPSSHPPQDILYVPNIDRPIRRRNRFYPPPDRYCSTE